MRSALISLILLAACAQTSTTAPPSNTDPDACGAARFRHLVGTDASSIDRSTLPPRARIIRPDDAATMDFSAERLNIRVGADGKVTEVACF